MTARQTRATRALAVLFFGLLATSMPGCGKEKPRPQADTDVAPDQPAAAGGDLAETAEAEDEVVDRGDECRTHSYLVAPGSNETLTFHVHLGDDQMGQVTPSDFRIEDDQWTEHGLGASVGMAYVETVPASYPTWVVYAPDFLAQKRDQGTQALSSEQDGTRVRWNDVDDYGTIEKVKGRGSGAIDIGKLSEDELRNLNGGEMTISYSEGGPSYTWNIERGSLEKDESILVFDLVVSLPPEAGGLGEPTVLVQGPSTGWYIRARYNPAAGKYMITGPGQPASCFPSL
jgi:hypothetical protein